MELASINGNVRSYRLDVPRGLFVLRYVDREISQAPIISVRPLPGSEHSLTIIHHPDLSPTILDRPGAAVVVSSQGRASLEISAQARAFGGSLEARVDLEPLVKPSVHEHGRDEQVNLPRLATSDTELVRRPDDSVGLSILGHVSRRGDVVVQGGNWIAGPDAPSPIEGIEIRVESRASSWLESQVLASGDANWSGWQSPGQFLGSRGRARPLVGMRIRTTPSAPHDLSVDASALFLGSPVLRREGAHVELRSPAGHDPIVGLQIGVILANLQSQVSENITGAMSSRRGKVRVFRAGSPATSSAT
jgi:hypothetical protein